MANVTLHNYCTPNPWFNTRALFVAGGEAGGESAPKSAVDQYQEQVVNKLDDPEMKADLIRMMDLMEGHKVPPAKILTLVGGAIEAMKAEGVATNKKETLKKAWKELAKDGVLDENEVKELIKTETRLKLQTLMEDLKSPWTYLKRADGSRVLAMNDPKVNETFTIDFGLKEEGMDQNKAKQALQYHLTALLSQRVRSVEITSSKDPSHPKTLVRCPDGEFREKGKESGPRFQIGQGDKITIKNQNDADAVVIAKEGPLAIPVDEPATEPEVKSIQKNTTSSQEKARETQTDDESTYVETAIGTSRENYGKLGPMVSRTLNPELSGWSVADFDNNIKEMDYGEAVLGSLNRFAKLGGYASGMETWKAIYDERNPNDKVTFNEVTHAVMGQDADNLRYKYFELRDDTLPYLENRLTEVQAKNETSDRDETRDTRYDARIADVQAQIKEREQDTDRTDRLNKKIEEAKGKSTDASLSVQQRGYYRSRAKALETRLNNQDLKEEVARLESMKALDTEAKIQMKIAETKNRLAQMEEFYKASVIFMASVEHLSYKEAPAATPEKSDIPKEVQDIQAVCDLLFDHQNAGPMVAPSFWGRVLHGEQAHVLTMGLNEGKADLTDTMQKHVTDKAAWEMLQQWGMNYGENGEVVVDKDKFLKEVNVLITMGTVNMQDDPDWSERVKTAAPQNFTSWEEMVNTLKGESSPIYKEAIRQGMVYRMGKELAKNETDRRALQEAREQMNAPETLSPSEMQTVEIVESLVDGLTPEQKAELEHNVHEYYIATGNLLVGGEGKGVEASLLASLGVETILLQTPKITIRSGISTGLDGVTYTQNIEAHTGADATLVRKGRFELHLNGGANAGFTPERGILTGGAGLSASEALGPNRVYTLHAGVGSGLTPYGLAFALNIGIDRNVGKVLARNADYLAYENAQGFEEGMKGLKELIPEEDYATFREQLVQYYQMEMGDQATEDLKGIQFMGANINFAPGHPPVPCVKIGIKGRIFTAYQASQEEGLSEIEEKRRGEAIQKQMGTAEVLAVYESGYTLRNANGERILGKANVHLDMADENLKAQNEALATQGMHLETVEKEGKTMLRLSVSKVDGKVDIYPDPGNDPSKVNEAFVGEDGAIYINWNQLDSISFSRTDEYTGVMNHGTNHRVEIGISSNPQASMSTIKAAGDNHISYQADVMGNIVVPAKTVTESAKIADGFAQLEEENGKVKVDATRMVAYESLNAMTQSGVQFAGELPALSKAAREKIEAVMEREAASVDLNATQKTTIEGYAKAIMVDKATRLDYKEISLGGNHEKIAKMVKEKFSTFDWNPQSMSYMMQALMQESLSTASQEVVTRWNKEALTKALDASNDISTAEAKAIAGKMVDHFNTNIKTGRGIELGSIVQIMVGTEGLEGYRENDWASKEGQLMAAANLDQNGLQAMGLSATEAAKVEQIFTEKLSPLPQENPEALMRSPLGLAVLDAADVIFDPQAAMELATLFEKVTKDSLKNLDTLSPAERSSYNNYVTLVKTLREKGTWENDSLTLSTKTDKAVGLYNKCLNFTAMINERLSIQMKKEKPVVTGVSLYDTLEGRKGVEILTVGGAVNTIPTPPPPGDKLEGEKTADGEIEAQGETPDVVRPTQTNNPAGIGQGGTPTE